MDAGLIRLAVVEDHPLYRRGLVQIVHGAAGLELVADTESLEQLEELDIDTPRVVILDLHLPGAEGPEAIRRVLSVGASVLVLSASENADEVIEAIGAGAADYLTKSADTEEIIRAVTIVAAGGTYVSPVLAGHLLSRAHPAPGASTVLELTAREREILELVAEGETDADIAEALFISTRTVHSHLDRIRDKTGHRRRSELTRYAIEHHLARPPGGDR